MTAVARKHAKKATNVSIREDLLRDARLAGVNLSQTLEAALVAALRERNVARWREENASAIAAYNEIVDREGLPLEAWRMF